APAELDRRARIEDADEILSPGAYQIAGRPQIVKALHEFRRRSGSVFRPDPRHFAHRAAIVLDGQHELRHSRLAFARSTALIAPSAWARTSEAVKDTLCPPTKMNVSG